MLFSQPLDSPLLPPVMWKDEKETRGRKEGGWIIQCSYQEEATTNTQEEESKRRGGGGGRGATAAATTTGAR